MASQNTTPTQSTPAPAGDPKDPATGQVPGFRVGQSLFTMWTNMLLQQSNHWNANWVAMLNGEYDTKAWAKAVAQSVQISAATGERMCQVLNGSTSPPWVSLGLGAETPAVQLKEPLNPGEVPYMSPMTHLGSAPASGSVALTMAVDTLDSSSVKVRQTNAPSDAVAPGQYIGFVLKPRHAEPLVIVMVSVSA